MSLRSGVRPGVACFALLAILPLHARAQVAIDARIGVHSLTTPPPLAADVHLPIMIQDSDNRALRVARRVFIGVVAGTTVGAGMASLIQEFKGWREVWRQLLLWPELGLAAGLVASTGCFWPKSYPAQEL